MSGSDVITTAGPVASVAFERVCRACGNPVRPNSLICVKCGEALRRVPRLQQGSMIIPALVLGTMVTLVAYLASSLGA